MGNFSAEVRLENNSDAVGWAQGSGRQTMMTGEGVHDAFALHVRELVPPTVLETAPALLRTTLLDTLIDSDLLELSTVEVVRLATQGFEALGARLAFVDGHARLVQDPSHVSLLALSHSSYRILIRK